MTANKVRGEVALAIGAKTYRLCLTLGALAEIESALGLVSLAALEDRLKRFGARDVVAVLAALLRGGGNEVSDGELAAAPLDLAAAMHALAQAFAAAGFAPVKGDAPGEAPAPPETVSGGAGSRSRFSASG